MYSSRAFQWMVKSTGFDHSEFLGFGQFLGPPFGGRDQRHCFSLTFSHVSLHLAPTTSFSSFDDKLGKNWYFNPIVLQFTFLIVLVLEKMCLDDVVCSWATSAVEKKDTEKTSWYKSWYDLENKGSYSVNVAVCYYHVKK